MNIVLHEPQIPPNTGNVVRTCKATGSVLHLIEPLGFLMTDKTMRRAGLDYWRDMDIRFYPSFEDFIAACPPGAGLWLFTTKGDIPYHKAAFQTDDYLLFGREDAGLPDSIRLRFPHRCLRVPMVGDTRSLNLSNTVALTLFEALRQTGFHNLA